MRKLLALAMLAALTTPVAGARAALRPQNDAGSGTDAPGTPTASFRIDPGVLYTGQVEGNTTDDRTDWYAFTAPAGAAIEARISSTILCAEIYEAAGAVELGSTCSIGLAEMNRAKAVATAAGTYYVRIHHAFGFHDDTVPQAYRFGVGVNAPAPEITPTTVGDHAAPPAPRGIGSVAPASEDDEHVVVAVVDSGINPYHDFFAAPALTGHPSTWLPGFPASAESVGLALDEASYAAARTADSATWAGLARSTYDEGADSFDTHLYTFPGTRVVGAVSFGEYEDLTDPLAPTPVVPVLDEYGHGTHSAGLALGAHLAEADGNVLLVMVEAGGAQFSQGIKWAARQPWIDAISLSIGGIANAPATFSPFGQRTGAEWATLEADRAGKPVFVASGNGFSGTGQPPDHCSTYTSDYTGPAWVTRVGAADERSGNPTWWHCVPVEAIARTNVDSPSYDDLSAVGVATGTSAATPNLAGHWAHLMLTARRHGSSATPLAARDYLLHAAAPARNYVGEHDPSAYPVSLADQGYGLVDQAALDAATARLLAGSGPAPRPETEAWFEADNRIRTALWGPGSVTAGPRDVSDSLVAQDDAGSGGDAPDLRGNGVAIEPGVRYDGTTTGFPLDSADWYTFDGGTGDVIAVALSAAFGCWDLVSPSGVLVANNCSAGYAAELPNDPVTLAETGTWHLGIGGSYGVQSYAFGFGRNGPPPAVL